jgi:hypothetical protein
MQPSVWRSLPKSSRLPPPPPLKIHCIHTDPQLLQRFTRQMTVIWSLNASIGIIALSIRNHAIKWQAHNLSKQLAYLIFRVFILGGEL